MSAGGTERTASQTLKRVGTAVTLWLIFSVIVGILPIILGYARMESRAVPVTVADVIARGEMALICVGLAAGPLGLLIGTGNKWLFSKIIACGMSFVFAAFAAAYSSDRSAHELQVDLELRALLSTVTDDAADIESRKDALGGLQQLTSSPHADKEAIKRKSFYLLVGTIISGASCVALSELDA